MYLNDLAVALVDALDRAQRSKRTYDKIRALLTCSDPALPTGNTVDELSLGFRFQLVLADGTVAPYNPVATSDVVSTCLESAGATASQAICSAWDEIFEIASRGKSHCEQAVANALAAANGDLDGQEAGEAGGEKAESKISESKVAEGKSGGEPDRGPDPSRPVTQRPTRA